MAGRRRWWLGGLGVVLAVLLAASAAGAAPASTTLVGTWTSWFTCTSGCGGVYQHATTVSRYGASTGDFSGTDSNGPIVGTVTGSSFSLHTTGDYHFSITGSIGSFHGYPCWSGFLVAQNGSGPWIGSQDPTATEASLQHCGPGLASAVATVNPQVSSIAALPTPAAAFKSVKSDVIDAAITLGMALFLTFPSNLFNSTFEENYDYIVGTWRKWLSAIFPPGLRRWFKALMAKEAAGDAKALGHSPPAGAEATARPTKLVVTVIIVGALLGSFLDPSFGANARSVLVFVGILIAMVTGLLFSGLITVGYHRARHHGKVPFTLDALPAGLVIAVVCVVISRASGFAPGYLYGIICGVTFARPLTKNEEGHLVALGAWFRVALAVVAWMAWAAITHDATKPGSFFGLVLLDDFLASLFVSSLVGTVISLFPLRFLPGEKLKAWRVSAWAATFVVTLFVLVQVLLRPHSTSSGPSHTPLILTIVLFALFAGASVLFREHFARKRRTQDAAAHASAATPLVKVDQTATEETVGGTPMAEESATTESGAQPTG